MAFSLAGLLNQTIYASRLQTHWSGPGVRLLTMALYDADPMGLGGFGVPRNEYEGEAVWTLARLLGHATADAFLAAEPPANWPQPDRTACAAALQASFEQLFETRRGFEDDHLLLDITAGAVQLMAERASSLNSAPAAWRSPQAAADSDPAS